jgi:hypothetical protein
MPVHASTQCIFIDPRNPILVSPICPQEPIEDDATPRFCGPLFPEDPSGGGELRPRSFTGLPILLLMDEWQPVFPDEDGTKGGKVYSFVPQFPEDGGSGGELRPVPVLCSGDEYLGGVGFNLLAMFRPSDGGGTGGRDRAPRFEPDENSTGGGSYIPEDPAGGGDLCPRQCGPDEPPVRAGGDVPPFSNHEIDALGGGASDLVPSGPDGGALGGDGLRNLIEVPQFPEERDGKGGKRASGGALGGDGCHEPVFFPTEPAGCGEDEPSYDKVSSYQPTEMLGSAGGD